MYNDINKPGKLTSNEFTKLKIIDNYRIIIIETVYLWNLHCKVHTNYLAVVWVCKFCTWAVIKISVLWFISLFIQFQPLLQLGHPLPEDSQLTVTISLSSTSTGGVGVASRGTRGPHLCGDCNPLEYVFSMWVLVQSNHLKNSWMSRMIIII